MQIQEQEPLPNQFQKNIGTQNLTCEYSGDTLLVILEDLYSSHPRIYIQTIKEVNLSAEIIQRYTNLDGLYRQLYHRMQNEESAEIQNGCIILDYDTGLVLQLSPASQQRTKEMLQISLGGFNVELEVLEKEQEEEQRKIRRKVIKQQRKNQQIEFTIRNKQRELQELQLRSIRKECELKMLQTTSKERKELVHQMQKKLFQRSKSKDKVEQLIISTSNTKDGNYCALNFQFKENSSFTLSNQNQILSNICKVQNSCRYLIADPLPLNKCYFRIRPLNINTTSFTVGLLCCYSIKTLDINDVTGNLALKKFSICLTGDGRIRVGGILTGDRSEQSLVNRIIKVVVDEREGCIKFRVNGVKFAQIDIPAELRRRRMYPFLQMSAGEQIQFVKDSHITKTEDKSQQIKAYNIE